jgi:hypothetical protein
MTGDYGGTTRKLKTNQALKIVGECPTCGVANLNVEISQDAAQPVNIDSITLTGDGSGFMVFIVLTSSVSFTNSVLTVPTAAVQILSLPPCRRFVVINSVVQSLVELTTMRH